MRRTTACFVRRMLFVTGFLLYGLSAAVSTAADYRVVTTEELQAMTDRKEPFVLIDTRSVKEYQEAHIIGAINVPENQFDAFASRLPEDRNAVLVLYCSGVKCGKSIRMAPKVEALGYKNIVIYREGFPVWEERGLKIVPGPEYEKKIETTKLSPADLRKMIDSGASDYALVDVRDESEYREGHIPGAVNIPAEIFAAKSDILPKEKKIVVYCNAGSRSYMAYRKLMKMEYKNIYQTLFSDWKDAGMPVEK